MAKSLAFWLVNPKEKDGKNTHVELHFNYWSLKVNNERKFSDKSINYLDVGVRLSEIGIFDSIKLYLPFDGRNLKYNPCLGKDICVNSELIPVVFNSEVTNTMPNEKLGTYDITFEKKDKNPSIRFFTDLSPESENSSGGVKIVPEIIEGSSGVIIEFPWKIFKDFNDEDAYFRFRIELSKDNINSLSKNYNPKWSIVTNYFEKCEIIDFRINEYRNLPIKIRKEIGDNTHIKKVHFFLIRDAKSEYRMSHDVYHRCRILETNIWDKYLGVEIKDSVSNQMLIYHWKSEAKDSDKYIENFSAFAKFTVRTLIFFDIIFVIFSVILLGIVSGITTNLIWKLSQDKVESCEVILDAEQELRILQKNVVADTSNLHNSLDSRQSKESEQIK